MEAWSESLASLPAAFHADRAELLDLMRKRGDSLRVAHTADPLARRIDGGVDAEFATGDAYVARRGTRRRCVLELLKRFEGRQIATLGLTAVPILNSCIMQSGGRYHGLLLRQQRKKHGSLKLIEGPIDPDEPTIVIDDSISSGTSMQLASDTLSDAGIRVEGGIFLVRFGWYGGYAAMQEQGYHVEAVTDIWTDFIYHMDDEPKPIGNPTKIFPSFQWSDARRSGKTASRRIGADRAARVSHRRHAAAATARGLMPITQRPAVRG